LKIPPFGVLYKKIKNAQYRLHLTWEERTGRRNTFPKASSVQQENSQVSPGYPSVAYKALVG
jgi:hypothetical protein